MILKSDKKEEDSKYIENVDELDLENEACINTVTDEKKKYMLDGREPKINYMLERQKFNTQIKIRV